ncbi:B12-binding domain-containing radical SAM protein [Candidatus Pacearchaeota archaeon]|nr:B12-binding domain-containing radical SAM protein [Candidatus Pacearchaeota archaeon]
MKIVFVDPGFGKRSWGTFGQSHWTSIIHQGLCGLSACAKEAGYTDIHLLDIRQLKDWSELESQFKKIDPDVVVLTMRSCDMFIAAEIAKRFKKIQPNCIITVGGIHCSIDPQYALDIDEFDYVVQGEGEISFVNLLGALQEGRQVSRHIIGERPDLDKLPFIDRELYPYQTAINLPNYEGIFRAPMVTMLCSRGCMFKCKFCFPHSPDHFGKGVRLRSVDSVISELKMLHDKYKFNCVKFYDYTFTQYPKWADEFCDKYREIGKPFWIQSRADLVCRQEPLIEKLAAVGLKMVGVGFESGSDRVLKSLRKGATRDINLRAAEIIKRHGILLSGSFMLGTPDEVDEDVEMTVSMAQEMKPHFTSVAFFTPIPGNELYEECKDRDLILNPGDPEMWVEFSPEIPKIKGKNYDYLREAADRIMGDRFGGILIGKVIRYLYVKTKYHYRLRNALVFIYSLWVNSSGYRIVQKCRKVV